MLEMDNQTQQDDQVAPERRIRYNLRSSLKRTSRVAPNMDCSDESLNITTAVPTRRVSFAASSTVKPFVNDDENNTIWDNTYEEAINHTDSSALLSGSQNKNINKTTINSTDMSLTCRNFEVNILELGNNHIQENEKVFTSVMESTLSNQENILVHKRTRKSKKEEKPLRTQTQVHESSDMEIECLDQPMQITFENTAQPIDTTLYQETDMTLTCKFEHSVAVGKLDCQKVPVESLAKVISNQWNTSLDMEFTCQFPAQDTSLESKVFEDLVVTSSSKGKSMEVDIVCNDPQTVPLNEGGKLRGLISPNYSEPFKIEPRTDEIIQSQKGLCKYFTKSLDEKSQHITTDFKTGTHLLKNEYSEGPKRELGDIQCSIYLKNEESVNANEGGGQDFITIKTESFSNSLKTEVIEDYEKYEKSPECMLSPTKSFSCLNNEKLNRDGSIHIYTGVNNIHQPLALKSQSQDSGLITRPEIHAKSIPTAKKSEEYSAVVEIGNIPIAIDNRSTDTSGGVPQNDHHTSDGDKKWAELTQNIKFENLDDEECRVVDITTSFRQTDMDAIPSKVIYTEPMQGISTVSSMLHFSQAFSSVNNNSASSVDNTQELLEAQAGLSMDNTKHGTNRHSLDLINRMLGTIDIGQYEPHVVDYTEEQEIIKESKELIERVRRYKDNFRSPKKRCSILSESVRRLSLASSHANNSADCLMFSVEYDTPPVEAPISLQQQIQEKFNNTKKIFLALETLEPHYVVFRTFSRLIKVVVSLHEDDNRVVEIHTESMLHKVESRDHFYNLVEFLIKCVLQKMEMSSLKLSLGPYFDVLSLLDHVYMILDKASNFCDDFVLQLQRRHPYVFLPPFL
ncbi:uncharacterized protein [Euwallacea similis]|uniref:uncharacterized protein isoform X2 n=1 Tax=Euwallacea similis TaxID=1736056 RepID=UPI00344B60E4